MAGPQTNNSSHAMTAATNKPALPSPTLTTYLTKALDKCLSSLGTTSYADSIERQEGGLSSVSPYEYAPRLKPAPLSCGGSKWKKVGAVGDVDGVEKDEEKTTRGFKKRSTSPIQKWMELSSTAKAETSKKGASGGVGKVEGK